jgi:type I restriction enzyme S subunit
MKRIKPYSKYKDSKIAWLGKIPEHWKLSKAKYILFHKKKVLNPDLNCGSISFGKIVYKDNERVPFETKATYQELLKGEFLINPLNLNFDLKSLRTGLSEIDVVVSTGYIVLQNNPIFNKSYLKWLLHQFDVSFMKTLGDGVRQTLSYTDFKNTDFPYISIEEQISIAQFLDYKTAKIDRFIRKKKQIIKLLVEQKAGIINDTVTKGLNDKANTKPSGIDWLGNIPAHWEVKKLKYIANCFPSNIDKHSKEGETQIRLCNYTDVYKNDYITNDMNLMLASATEDQINKFTLIKGDVLITKDSETASDIAVPALVSEDLENVVCGYHLAVLRPMDQVLSEYLFRALQCKPINIQYELCSNGVTRVGLGVFDMKKAKIPVPPKSEQEAIIVNVKQETSKLTQAISTIEKEIALVQEYRTALISEAVTGKIDLRNYDVPEFTKELVEEDSESMLEDEILNDDRE